MTMRGFAAVALAFALFGQGQSRDTPTLATGTAVIRGRTLTADGTPIRKARVTLTSDTASPEPAYSDADGRFEFPNLPAGRYGLAATKTGFAPTRLGARSYIDRPVPVDVAAGTVIDGIEIRLSRAGAISGRVVDTFGDPIAGAWVAAGMLVSTGGRPQVRAATSALVETDDLGEFRIGSLAAGQYVVTAAGSSANTSAAPAGLGWTKTYYPGVPSLVQAAMVGVSAGSESGGIDFTFSAVRLPKLSISAQDAAGNPIGGLVVLLRDLMSTDTPGAGAVNRGVPFSAGMKPTTTLEPGDWVAILTGRDGTAIAHLTLGSDDTSVSFVAGKGGRMAGRVAFDSENTPPPYSTITAGVRRTGADALLPGGPGFGSSPPSKVTADGTFEVAGILGTVEPHLVTSPRGWILKSATHNGRDLLDAPADFKGGEQMTGVQLVMTDRVSEIAGLAVDSRQQPARGCSVIVFPEDRTALQREARWTRWERTDQNGRFFASGLPAGNYLIVATDSVDPSVWSTSAYLDRYRPSAARLTLADGEKKTVALECMSTP